MSVTLELEMLSPEKARAFPGLTPIPAIPFLLNLPCDSASFQLSIQTERTHILITYVVCEEHGLSLVPSIPTLEFRLHDFQTPQCQAYSRIQDRTFVSAS